MILLKLGGSLITDKKTPEHARLDVIRRIATEIAAEWQAKPGLNLIIGHGSGSFGHSHASRYGTRSGADSAEAWAGFVKVWQAADRLNRIMMDELSWAGLPVIRFAPSAMATAKNGQLAEMTIAPIQQALEAGLLPVVYGDVIFDQQQGCTIASTEDVFIYLATHFQVTQVLLAGIEAGVYAGLPGKSEIVSTLSPDQLNAIQLGGSHAPDVTGGMLAKVNQAFQILQLHPGANIHIFSGTAHGSITAALQGQPGGTQLLAPAAQ